MNNELTAALLTIEKCRELSGCPAGVDLQDWVKKLAAENVQVRERHRFIRALAVSILEHTGGRRDWRGAMEDASDLVKTVDEVYSNTPATDSIVAEAEARGVEKFAAKLRIPGDDQFFDAVAEGVAGAADAFAKQLREGADK
ncbi:hypothetical protein ACJEQG_11370 [Klebsiella aerogenes]|uniref:hypothetical protein n=1 Tax=Klebsiella aerogenes TaxID=548 RepID=UPI0038726FB3